MKNIDTKNSCHIVVNMTTDHTQRFQVYYTIRVWFAIFGTWLIMAHVLLLTCYTSSLLTCVKWK